MWCYIDHSGLRCWTDGFHIIARLIHTSPSGTDPSFLDKLPSFCNIRDVNGVHWPTVWIAFGSAIITGLFTSIASWLLYHFQLKTKVTELKAQAQLRARELLFNSYQKRMEDITKNAYVLGDTLGKFAELLQRQESEHEKRESLVAITYMMRVVAKPLSDSVRELELDLAQVGLAERRQDDILQMRQALAVDFDAITLQDVGPIYLQFMAALGLFYSIKDELLTKKCEELFSKYLVS